MGDTRYPMPRTRLHKTVHDDTRWKPGADLERVGHIRRKLDD